jgi:hypothetical protein
MPKTITVPKGVSNTLHAQATRAASDLVAIQTGATNAANAVIGKSFTGELDGTALALAVRVANQLAGITAKVQGGAQDNVNKVSATLIAHANAHPEQPVTAVLMVAMSRAQLDNAKARGNERTAAKASLAAQFKDSSKTLEQRVNALTVLDGMQTADDKAKRENVIKTLDRAIVTALKTLTLEDIATLVSAHGDTAAKRETLDAAVTF